MVGAGGGVLRKCDYETLEKTLMVLARKAVGKKGSYEHTSGRRQHPNKWVREFMDISSCHFTLRTRRLTWLLDILKHPGENIQLRSALWGKYDGTDGRRH